MAPGATATQPTNSTATTFNPIVAGASPSTPVPTVQGLDGPQPVIQAQNVGNTPSLVIPPPASNSNVAQLQQMLNSKNAGAAGYTPLKVDGVYGPLTAAANSFQAPAAPADPNNPTSATPSATDTTSTSTDPILSQIQSLISQEGGISDQENTNNANKDGLYRSAVLSNATALTATNSAINDQVNNLEKFYTLNQDNLTDSQKIQLQSTLDQQKTDAATLTSAKDYAYKAAVKAGDSADVLAKIANATDSESVYSAIEGTGKYTGEASPTLISIGQQKLDQARGPDGYTDPNLYQSAFQDWTAKGYTAASFLKAYPPDQYVNPANTTLPEYLMPTAAQAKTSSSSNSRST